MNEAPFSVMQLPEVAYSIVVCRTCQSHVSSPVLLADVPTKELGAEYWRRISKGNNRQWQRRNKGLKVVAKAHDPNRKVCRCGGCLRASVDRMEERVEKSIAKIVEVTGAEPWDAVEQRARIAEEREKVERAIAGRLGPGYNRIDPVPMRDGGETTAEGRGLVVG